MYPFILQVVEEKYSQSDQGPEQPIEFESNEIKLDIPREGTKLKEGWMVIPMIKPIVSIGNLMILCTLSPFVTLVVVYRILLDWYITDY